MFYTDQETSGTSRNTLQDFEPSFGTKMQATIREAWMEGYWQTSADKKAEVEASSVGPKLTAADAKARIEASGLRVKISPKDGEYTDAQLGVILERQRELTVAKDVRERTPWDWGTPVRGVAMFGTGIVDPINLATAFVPWTRMVGAAKGMRAMTQSASWLTRAGGRAGLGAIDGGISTLALEPAYAFARRDLGDDYTALDSMVTIAMGTAFGGGIHSIGGAGVDAFRKFTGRAQPWDAPAADPDVISSPPPAGMATGGDARVRIGDVYEPAQWAVLEADQLTATVDKADNQFRDRSRAAYQTEITARANSLDPAQVLTLDSPLMDVGPPTVSVDGRIIGGNGRTLFMQRAYDIGKGAEYRAELERKLIEIGIDPEAIRTMQKPVLVRRLTRQVDVKKAAMLSNEGGSSAMSPLEQAKVDAERLGDARLETDADGSLDTVGNRAAIRKWVEQQPEGQRNALITEDGRLSAAGLQRMRNAVLFKAYGDSPTLARLIEATDVGSRNVAAALTRSVGRVAEAEQAIGAGQLHPMSIADDIRLAVEQFDNLRRQGTKVEEYLAQMDMLGSPLSDEARLLLAAIGRNISSSRRIADVITGYYDRLVEAGNPGQGDMFGASVPSKLGMLDDSIRAAESSVDTAAEVMAAVSPETREATLRAAVGQSAAGRVVDVDAIVRTDPAAGTATVREVINAAERNQQPEAIRVADFEAAEAVQSRVDAAPKWSGVKDAEAAMAEADSLLADTVKAGDEAFKYSRGKAKGQKKATLWQGTTARFGAEEGAPLGRFRWDMINSSAGEGAQAFGYGHYLAQQAWISQQRYRERLIGRKKNEFGAFEIPDGAGGVMRIGKNNDPAWQLADGTIVHEGQQNIEMAAKAAAITAVERSGYKKARQTFESIIEGNKEYADVRKKRMDDFLSSLDTEAERAEWNLRYENTYLAIQRELDIDAERFAALDEVTVEAGDTRVLAPGVKKYEPPVPENMRVRVLVGDEEITGPMADWLIKQAEKNPRGLSQQLGLDLKQGPTRMKGANVEFRGDDFVGAGAPEWDVYFDSIADKTIRVEYPGSLYRAEMDVDVFKNLMLWDAPLSEQPKAVLDAFKKLGIDGDLTGQQAYRELVNMIEEEDGSGPLSDIVMSADYEVKSRRAPAGTDPIDLIQDYNPEEMASVILNQQGIPGHAFLDGNSHGAGDGAYNLVIYADDVARIVDRYARQTGELLRATDDPEELTEALRLSFGKSTDALISTGRIRIVGTPDEMPGGPHPGDVKGWAATDGTVYIVASNVAEAEARGMVLHEVGVHVGLRNMLGDELFDGVLRELDDAILRGDEWAQAARDRVPADTAAGLVREEQLAYLVQNAPELGIVKKIIAAVRAWAYRTFSAARDNMTLTEADFRALAVSALHAAARETDAPVGAFAYSRSETPDPSTAADELKPYDEAVKRAKQYAGVLRAAADKLDNDAQATAAMRAAMPDISPAEITDLLDQLRTSVKGLRGVARSARESMGAEDQAGVLQSDAMHAADTLANNIQMAAVIEKRNAALNIAARLRASSFVNQFKASKLDSEGFYALLGGSERVRSGSRVSVDAEYKGFRGEWVGGMIADVEKLGLMREFVSGAFDRDIYDALWRMGQKKPDLSGLSPEAVKLAEVVNKYQSDARNTRNRFGAWIRDLQGYITRQSHDMFKIRAVSDADWIKFVLPKLDLAKMQKLGLIGADPAASLRKMYDDFAAGVHMKAMAGEDDTAAFGTGSSLAKRESVSRALYFKDGVSAFEYNEKFGVGRLAESVLGGLDQSARSASLLKTFGTNPEAALNRLMDDYENSLVGEPERRAAFRSDRQKIMNMMAHVDGSALIPGNVTAAKIGSFLRAWQSMAKLGGALISSVTDLTGYAAELRYAQGKNLFSGVLEGIGALTQGRAAGERAQVLASLGVFHESVLGSVSARFDNPDLIGGKMAAAQQQFFRLNGLAWWTETLRDGAALAHSNYLAENAARGFDKLPAELRRMLGLYNIDAGKWDILRLAATSEADGRKYMTPDGLRTVPRAAFENYIQLAGRTVNDATVANLQADLAQALRTMHVDRAHHAILEPGARTRAWMLRGSRPGTVPGEFLRYVGQFKSFSVAMTQMTLGREIYGRGYDTLGEYLKKGHGDMVGLATYIGLTMAMGYAAMSIKDLLKGKEPRPVDDPKTWAAAMVQGGGLGLYGDFLFGEYSRMGRSFTSSLAGPVLGNLDLLADLKTRLQRGDDTAAATFNGVLQNTPFMNLFYARPVLDYLIIYQIQEALNPGFLRRMERRAERDNGQSYLLPPSQYAR